MSYAFHDIKHIVQPYLDDLPAHSMHPVDHPIHLRAIFLRCCRSSNTPPCHFPSMLVLPHMLESPQMCFLRRIRPTSGLYCFTSRDQGRSFEGRGDSQSPSSFLTFLVTKFAREGKLSPTFHPELC
jgi:hypothetical protein